MIFGRVGDWLMDRDPVVEKKVLRTFDIGLPPKLDLVAWPSCRCVMCEHRDRLDRIAAAAKISRSTE